MTVEDEYTDVLQNIEAAIVGVYREHRELVDWDALSAIEALIRAYSAEAHGKPATLRAVPGLTGQVAQAVRAMCEWRLGRENLTDEGGNNLIGPEPISLDVMLACLKRIRLSIQRWNKEGGRQGYLNFAKEFIL